MFPEPYPWCLAWSDDHDRTAETLGDDVAVSADLAKVLDKAFEDLTLTEVLDAPVSALSGVSAGDAELLANAFSVKTVRDLGVTSSSAPPQPWST